MCWICEPSPVREPAMWANFCCPTRISLQASPFPAQRASWQVTWHEHRSQSLWQYDRAGGASRGGCRGVAGGSQMHAAVHLAQDGQAPCARNVVFKEAKGRFAPVINFGCQDSGQVVHAKWDYSLFLTVTAAGELVSLRCRFSA